MGSTDGSVIGTKKIVNRGPDSACFNIVLIAEGYKKDEQADFEKHCDAFAKAFTALSPYNDCAAAINIHRINVSSTESGADDPKTTDCAGTGTTVKTYFDSSFCTGKIRRLMSFDSKLAIKVLNAQVPAWDRAIILVNSSLHGGAGGQVAISTTPSGWTRTALHEFGHALGLADEYETWYGCPGTTETKYFKHSKTEPSEPNVTIETKRSKIKWRNFILPTTKVPTTKNADCSRCDTQANPVPADTIGAFEGAHYCHCGAYRPAFNCLMRTLATGVGYCEVCRAWIRRKIAKEITAPDLTITPWGYALTPPTQPYWQTPDIWGNPKTGQAKNDLHVRVRNIGKAAAPAFKVRLSFVPFTGLIDLANEILIDEVARPGLAAMATDSFVVNWDLTPPKLPAQYATFDHFCVIAEIKAKECNTANNRAQNNFTIVGKSTGTPPPPLTFEIANPWDDEAESLVELISHDERMALHPVDFDPEGMILAPRERRPVQVAFELAEELLGDAEAEPFFEITQALDGEIVGGICGVVAEVRPDPRAAATCPRCGAKHFVYRLVTEAEASRQTRVGEAVVSCGECGSVVLNARPSPR